MPVGERLKHLVVVLPGILGSELADANGRTVWGPSLWSIVRNAGMNPSVLSLEENPLLTPVALLSTITVVPPVLRVPGYDVLIDNIKRTFADVQVDTARPGWEPRTGTDVLLVPYDFRTGIVSAAEYVHDRVAEQLAVQSDRKVIVVGHSMGGLVARYWLGCLDSSPSCEVLITLGTPHGGAPKALDVLANGFQLKGKRFRGLTDIARGWPSVFDLLPRYPAVAVSGGDKQYPYELDALAKLELTDNARRAYDVHRDIDSGWANLGGQRPMRAVFSRGHPTLRRADGSLGGVTVSTEAAEWLPNPVWAGDGTVPADCAIPNELNERRDWVPTSERHLPLASAPIVTGLLRDYAGNTTSAMRGPEDVHAPDWGIDLEEIYPAGNPITVEVNLPEIAGDTTVWGRVLSPSGSGAPIAPVKGHRTGDRWSIELPELAAGTYSIRVDAVNVPGRNDLRCEDVVGVVAL